MSSAAIALLRLKNCVTPILNKCFCKKYGFKCLPACGQCHGAGCTNAPERQDDSDEMENSGE